MAEFIRPTEGIATDAAHSVKHGKTEYQGVNLATGERIFRKDIGDKTVNIGEFLAVVDAVKYIIETGFTPAIIYTDSMTAISWFNNKRTASSKPCYDLIRAEMFLRALSSEVDKIQVKHWDNRLWGETPADFGRK